MNSDWKIGDTILCIDSLPSIKDTYSTGLVVGQEYKIQDMHSCSVLYVNVGTPPPTPTWESRCGQCPHKSIGQMFHYAWRFIKQDPHLIYDEAAERTADKIRRYAINYGAGPEIFQKILMHRGNTE